MITITLKQAEEMALKMFNNDTEWKPLVEGKNIDTIRSIWREDYNIAICLIGEDYNIIRD